MPLMKVSSIQPSISPILDFDQIIDCADEARNITYQRVFAASPELGMGAAAAKFGSPEPFMLGPAGEAPVAVEAEYSAISNDDCRTKLEVGRIGRRTECECQTKSAQVEGKFQELKART